MRELTRREFYLMLVIPGLLLAGIYYFLLDSPARDAIIKQEQTRAVVRRSVDGLEKSITAAKAQPPPPIYQSRQEIKTLSDQITQVKRLSALNAHPSQMVPANWTNPARRINALHSVATTFSDNDLIILSRRQDPAQKIVPRELEDFSAAVKSDDNHPVPEVWKIEVVGSYGSLLTALDQLNQSEAFIVPLAVSMEMLPDDSRRRSWTVWIWV